MHRITTLILLLVLLPACTSRHYFPRDTTLPDDPVLPFRTCGDYFLADVELDGVPMTLVFDTGAMGIHLDHSAVRRHRAAAGSDHIDTLTFGGFTARDFHHHTVDFTAIADAFAMPIDGVLGYQVFKDALLIIDYPAGEVRLGTGSLSADDPMTVRYAVDRRHAPFLPFTIDGHETLMLLDTGARGGLQLTTFNHVLFEDVPRRLTRSVRTSGAHQGLVGRATNNATWGPIDIEAPVLSTGRYPALVGQEVLANYVLTFDQRQRLVRFEGPDAISISSDRGTGLEIDLGAEYWTILGPYDSVTLPEDLDVQPGDQIIAVNGTPVPDLGCAKFERGTNDGTPVESVTYTLRRDDATFDVTVPIQVLVP